MARQHCRHAIGPRTRRRQGPGLVACRQCCGQGRYRSIPADPEYPVCQSREGMNQEWGRRPHFNFVPFVANTLQNFWIRIFMVKKFLVPLICVLSVSMVSATKDVKKPSVHPDFQFGSYPWSRTADSLMKDELTREIALASTQGWDIDKMAKTFKVSTDKVSNISDKLEDERLIGREDDDNQKLMPIIRERDWDRMKDPVRRSSHEFTQLIEDNWKDIESMMDSLQGTKGIPKGRVMYETVVSGILLGGMMDAFYEDKTIMPPPRRIGKTDRYYAWLVESNPEAAGLLRRELRESAGYRVVSVGTALPEERMNPDEMRG